MGTQTDQNKLSVTKFKFFYFHESSIGLTLLHLTANKRCKTRAPAHVH